MVVNEISMAGFAIQELTELLSGPIGIRMICHIAVKNPPRTNLDRDEDVQPAGHIPSTLPGRGQGPLRGVPGRLLGRAPGRATA